MFLKCDEDGEFELEEDDINQTESPESIKQNVEDNDGDNTFLNQQRSSIDYDSPLKIDDDKSPSNQDSSSSSPLLQSADSMFSSIDISYSPLFYTIELYNCYLSVNF